MVKQGAQFQKKNLLLLNKFLRLQTVIIKITVGIRLTLSDIIAIQKKISIKYEKEQKFV